MLSLMTWTSTSSPRRKISWIGGLTAAAGVRRPPRIVLVDGARPRASGPAEAHLALELLDLLDLLADLLLELGVDLFLDGSARGLGGELVLLEVGVLDALELLQVKLVELAQGFDLLAAAAGEGPRGRAFLGEQLIEVRLEVIGGGRRGSEARPFRTRLAFPAAAATPATATALGPRPARPLLVQEGDLVLLRELGRAGLDVLLEQRLGGLAFGPFGVGREEVAAEGGVARLHPFAAGDVAGLTGAVVGPRPIAIPVSIEDAFSLARAFSLALALSRGLGHFLRAPPADVGGGGSISGSAGGGTSRGRSQSPPRERIAARPPRRRGDSSNRGISSNGDSSGGRPAVASGSNSAGGCSSRSAGDGRDRPEGPPARPAAAATPRFPAAE